MTIPKLFNRRRFLLWLLGFVASWVSLRYPTMSLAARKSMISPYTLPKGVSLAWKAQGPERKLGGRHLEGSSSKSLPLGSVMKLFTAAVLLEANCVRTETIFECRGATRIPGSKEAVHCLKPHSNVNLTEALGYSCNGYFVQATAKLPFRQWREYLVKWGLSFQEKPSELEAHLNAHHYIGLTPCVLMTPLTLLPLIEDLAYAKGWANMISSSTRRALMDGMTLAAREGTGKHLPKPKQGQMALKTGTVPYHKRFQSWAVGFFPASKPEVVFVLQDQRGSSQDKAVMSLKRWLLSVFPKYF